MYGARGRIGLLVTAVNTTLEPDFNRLAPDGVSVHAARMRLRSGTSSVDLIESLSEPSDVIEAKVMELADARVGVILYGCTSGSFAAGPDGDHVLQEVMTRAGRIPFVTTTAASVDALRALGIERPAVVTPYPAEVNARLESYLLKSGLTPTGVGGVEEPDVAGHAAHSPDDIHAMAVAGDHPGADGVFISCTQLRALDVVERLERDLGKPVVAANQASLWKSLAVLGIPDPIPGYGRLMRLARA